MSVSTGAPRHCGDLCLSSPDGAGRVCAQGAPALPLWTCALAFIPTELPAAFSPQWSPPGPQGTLFSPSVVWKYVAGLPLLPNGVWPV